MELEGLGEKAHYIKSALNESGACLMALFELDENAIHVSEFVYTFLQHGYAPLCRDFEDFYTRRLYHRIQVI